VEILVAYDVSTESPEGRRRLRRVAKACQAYGMRVQKSVFECIVDAGQRELLKQRLLSEINPAEDSLRIYRLREPREKYVEQLGRRPEFTLDDPLVV
jgi:CRISPR-associated protein Cas2